MYYSKLQYSLNCIPNKNKLKVGYNYPASFCVRCKTCWWDAGNPAFTIWTSFNKPPIPPWLSLVYWQLFLYLHKSLIVLFTFAQVCSMLSLDFPGIIGYS